MAAFNSSGYLTIQSLNTLVHHTRQKFPILHLNMRSIRNKHDDLLNLFSSLTFSFDVMLLTETWLTADENPPHFENYAYHGIVRPYGRRGGIAAYVKKPAKHEMISEFSVVNANVECLTVRVESIVVVAIYRPPAGKKQVFF